MPSGPGIRVDTGRRGRGPDPVRVRPADREADRPRRGPAGRDRPAAAGASPRPRSAGSRPRCRSTGLLAEPGFVDASALATTWVDTHWDGPAARAAAVRAAALAAGLAAIARDGHPEEGGAPRDAGTTRSAANDGPAPSWRTGGRAAPWIGGRRERIAAAPAHHDRRSGVDRRARGHDPAGRPAGVRVGVARPSASKATRRSASPHRRPHRRGTAFVVDGVAIRATSVASTPCARASSRTARRPA